MTRRVLTAAIGVLIAGFAAWCSTAQTYGDPSTLNAGITIGDPTIMPVIGFETRGAVGPFVCPIGGC